MYAELEQSLPEIIWFKDDGPHWIGRSKVDFWGCPKNKNYHIFLEIEKHRGHPIIHNLVKVWYRLNEDQEKLPVLFIQAFSEYYYSGVRNTERLQIEFVGRQIEVIERRFKYELIGKEFWLQTAEEQVIKMVEKIKSLATAFLQKV